MAAGVCAPPNVLLLDISMPGVGGTEAAQRIATDCPSVRVLALTMHEERGYVTRLLRAAALLGEQSAARGERQAAGRTDPARIGELTTRETEVLRLVARGHSNKEISTALGISVKTVETHKANGMTKLGLTNRAALVRFAMEEGWLDDGGG